MQKPARLLGLSLVLFPACGPKSGQTGSESESTTEASSTGEPTPTTQPTDSVSTGTTDASTGSTTEVSAATTIDPTSTTEVSATEVSATTVDATTSTTAGETTGPVPDTSTGDTDEPSETTGGMLCGGFQEAMTAWNLVAPPDLAGVDVGADVTLELACQIDGVLTTIEVEYTVAPDIAEEWFPGTELHLAYRITQPFWQNEWLALTSAESFSLIAIRADALTPPNTTPEEFFKKEMWLAEPCGPAEPDRCGMRETLGLGFSYILDDGTPIGIEVESGEYQKFGVFAFDEIFVERAIHLLEPVTCDDAPSTWIEAMLLHTSNL